MSKRRGLVILVAIVMILLIPTAALAADQPTMACDSLTAPGGTSTFRIALTNSDASDHSYVLATAGMSNELHSYFLVDGVVTDTFDIVALEIGRASCRERVSQGV